MNHVGQQTEETMGRVAAQKPERRQPSAPKNDRRLAPAPVKLSVHELRAGFSGSEVLRGISMEIEEQRVTAVIGPSGCGKSTFVRCLNRMHEVARGATVGG